MNIDIESVFRKAADDNKIVPCDWMPASRIRPFILNDPGEVWLEFHGESHGLGPDFLSPYSFFDFIVQKAEQFKKEWIKEKANGAKRVCGESYHVRYAEKLRQTLNLMADETPAIVEPALWWAPAQVYGVPDLIVHTSRLKDDFPDLFEELERQTEPGTEPDGYVVFEIRLGSKDKDEQKIIEDQIRLNTYILGHIQGWMPPTSFLFTRDAVDRAKRIGVQSKLGQLLDKDLRIIRDQFVEIKLHGEVLVPWCDELVTVNINEPSERWRTAKDMIAWEKTPGGDPRTLYRIGASQRDKLAELGFDSIDSLLQADPSSIPLEDELPNVGETRARRIRATLQANRTGLPVLPDPQATPAEKQFEFFIDFEYFNNLNVDFMKEWPRLLGREMLFMIGVGWEEQGKWKFRAFIAEKENLEHEQKMIQAFVEFLEAKTDGAFTDVDKTALYHWTNAEVSQSRRAAQRLNLPQGHPFRELPWVDLQKKFRQTPCGVPGAWDFGVKAVGKALGRVSAEFDPQWVGDLDDGLGAMVLGWKAYEKSKPVTSDEMKILRQYLEADCKALWCILTWMRTRDPGLPFGAPGQIYVGWENVKKGVAMPTADDAFVAFNDGKGVIVYLQPILDKRKSTGIKRIEHLIWGDWLRVVETQGDWRKIFSRGTVGWIHRRFIQEERLLEVNFLDVGQGDGCFIIMPDNQYILIDAGEKDHMYRFLRWRFHHFHVPITFEAAIITHPDKDHYFGFRKFFDKKDEAVQNIRFKHLYHNGIIERKSKDLGASLKSADGNKYLTEIVTDRLALQEILGAVRGGDFLKMIRAADQCERVDDIRMLGAGKSEVKYIPGYEEDKDVSIQVLAPVPEGPPGDLHLRWFENDAGKTKNGHSIVLRLKYGNVSLLLGGDLNIPAEAYLLSHYGGIDEPLEELDDEEKKATLQEAVKEAGKFFKSDVAKSCHHGSADVSSEFLQAVNAVATVVSSGDNESHCHPRPESLGVLGKHGRGARPLIFSTELARSSEEIIKHPGLVRMQLEDARRKDREIEFIDQLLHDLGRSVAVYGMITLRTDGEHVVIAQKLEKPRPNGQKWDLTLLSPGKDGRLCYKSKHGD